MFSEILKIVPKLDNDALMTMQKQLQSRFTKLAKSFGSGLVGALKGGGIAGIAIGLIDKILNPLKETQDAIDKMLKSSDDIATNANQFNTTAGKLYKLVALAKSAGLDQENLFTLITKFQGAVAQAKANPQDEAVKSVRNYTNQKDTAEGFFQFIQELQKMDKNQQILVQQQVFGEKQILKMADFLQTDFAQKFKEVGLDKVQSQILTDSIEKMAKLNDLADVKTAAREMQNIINKSGIINENMINSRDKSERLALEKEDRRIKSYEDLMAISQTSDKIFLLVDEGVKMIGSFIKTFTPQMERFMMLLEGFSKSPWIRGVKNLFGGKDD